MKIYLDFDRTLFNTKFFLQDLYQILEEHNIPINLFDKIKSENIKNGFNCFKILEKLKKSYAFNNSLYVDLERFLENDSVYLFEDVEEFLQYLKEKKFEIILLTKGDVDFQKLKISNTDIDKYFDNIIITTSHKGDLDIDYNGIFIDDNIEELESIMKNNPRKVIYINRYNNDKIRDSRFLTINSLKELYNIIK